MKQYKNIVNTSTCITKTLTQLSKHPHLHSFIQQAFSADVHIFMRCVLKPVEHESSSYNLLSIVTNSPKFTSFEERLKRRRWDTTITSTAD